jgi:methionyl-tRNA formyltransferase
MRVMFFGTSEFAVPSLEQLVGRGHAVVLCVTRPDRPQGRGRECLPSPVKQAALRLGLPLAQPDRLAAGPLASLRPEVGVVASYGQLIGPEALGVPAHGMLGVHPSLLPKYRGAAPVAWALLNGDAQTGVTIFRLDERLDGGPMLLRKAAAVAPDDTTQTLTGRLARLGAEALIEALAMLEHGQARGEPQREPEATPAPKVTKAQAVMDWRASAAALERLVRAMIPWPVAATTWRGIPLKVWKAAVHAAPDGAAAGSVVAVTARGIAVAAGDGALELQEVQLPGKRRMPASEFLAGHRITVGEKLGDHRLQT